MHMNKLSGISGNAPRADKSAVGAINRHLRMAGLVWEMPFSVHMEDRVSLFICIICPYALDPCFSIVTVF